MSVYKCKHFKIDELVCNHVLSYYKNQDQLWSFLDENLKKTIDIIREILGVPLIINQHGAGHHQRGMRCHLCDLVTTNLSPYISTHMQGKAADLILSSEANMTAEQARHRIEQSSVKLPCNIRFEHNQNGKPITWIHVDVRDNPQNKKVYWFDV